jgi:hypothetical protein
VGDSPGRIKEQVQQVLSLVKPESSRNALSALEHSRFWKLVRGRRSKKGRLRTAESEAVLRRWNDINEHEHQLAGGAPPEKPRDLKTVIFENEEAYVKFVEYAFREHNGRGLELTNIPVVASACLEPWLFKRAQRLFAMHPATEEEVQRVRNQLRTSGRKAFDPADIENFYVPGISTGNNGRQR